MNDAPEHLYDEDGTTIWIRGDLGTTHGKVRYMAWAGADLPAGFREMGVDRLIDLRVRKRHLHDAAVHRPDAGLIFDPDFSWICCHPDEPGAVEFWEVTA